MWVWMQEGSLTVMRVDVEIVGAHVVLAVFPREPERRECCKTVLVTREFVRGISTPEIEL